MQENSSTTTVILVPAYKCESTIVDTLDSIQAQGKVLEQVSEVVIADDGSNDNTAAVARGLWKSGIPLRILGRHYNCGEYASVNAAVMQFRAETDWFLILHADDIAKPGWLEAFLKRMKQAPPDVGLICSSYDDLKLDGSIKPGENKDEPVIRISGGASTVADTLMAGCWWHISGGAIRVKTFQQVGGLPKIMQQKGDWDFLLRVLSAGWTVEYMPRSYILYRDNPHSSSSLNLKRHTDILEAMTIIGRFHSPLSLRQVAQIHYSHCVYLAKRIGSSLLKADFNRILWALPALAAVHASFWTCVTDPKRRRDSQEARDYSSQAGHDYSKPA